jgi:hypothetical protein
MAKKKAHSATPKLTEAEQELVSHMEHGTSLRAIYSALTWLCVG